jgi:hypothetical protein
LRNFVGGQGTSAALQARVWEEFTGRIIAALREAANLLANGSHEAKTGYWCTGTRSVKSTQVQLPQEDAITHALIEALERVRQDASPDDLLRRRQICFPQQQPRSKQSRIGKHALTTDIQAWSLESDFLDLRIEAKVLFAGGDVTHYCGKKGLLRFSDVEPYTDKPIGMMVGYTVRHDDRHWTQRIQAKAKGSPEVKAFQPVIVENEEIFGSTLVSHECGEVLVLHIFLPFESKPSARSLDAAH